jgi:glycerate-2-kinase
MIRMTGTAANSMAAGRLGAPSCTRLSQKNPYESRLQAGAPTVLFSTPGLGKQWIRNIGQLDAGGPRSAALSLVNAALNAIDTAQVFASCVSLDGDALRIKDRIISLDIFRRIHVIGIGKAAHPAALALERILGARLSGGIVIGPGAKPHGSRFSFHHGTHPMPSPRNVRASGQIVALCQRLDERDLVLVIVSGGGSSLLCWPESECGQGRRLYRDFLRTGGTIVELNTVRKHLSSLKGGGLAKMLHPATVIGLILSDVPGDKYNSVASGPTYRDDTTAEDAARILEQYHLGGYRLTETPTDAKYFATVTNIPLVSNQTALLAMRARARALRLKSIILSDSLYDPAAAVARKMFDAAQGPGHPDLVLAGGEPELKVPAAAGRGGRNQHLALCALSRIKTGQVFVSFATDGQDNGPCAGAVADSATAEKARGLGLDITDYLNRFDSETFFEKTGSQIITGPTGANVSDLMLLLK